MAMRTLLRVLVGSAISAFFCGAVQAAPFAYITNGVSETVSVIDTAGNTIVATVPVGSGPIGVAVNPGGTRVYVANLTSNSISVIDTATNAVTATVTLGGSPLAVAVNPSGTRVYVTTVFSNNVSVIDAGTNTVVATVATGTIPGGIAVNPSGTSVYVAIVGTMNLPNSTILVIDAATNAAIGNVAVVGSPQAVAVNPAGTRVYATIDDPGSVAVIDTATNRVIASIPVAGAPFGVAVNPSGTRIYVADSDLDKLVVIDAATNTVIATVAVGISPAGVAVTPAGTRVYVANFDSDNVSVVDTATDTVIATIPVGMVPVALGQFIGPAVVTPPAAKPDLNQHGLTGSWYEAATGGQGVEVEVFANPSSGTGSTFVSWFTYDTVIGGAERQRWYTAQGQVVTGQPNAALTIYQNTGGNFNAPPVTHAQAVGTATLSFDTCSSGQLSYTFTDGTGRTGTIPLTRLTRNVTCSTTTSYPTNADFALSGNWYGGAATSGQGFTVEVNPSSGALFAAWYTYMPNGSAAGVAGQRWYTAQAAFTPGLRSMPVTIYETTGGVFDTPTPAGQKTMPVGAGTWAFQSCSAATFSYSFLGGSSNGLSGTITLSRVGPLPPGCTT
jgi:YVTN family beta-propeller protein